MHLEILVEDSSGARLIEILLPKILGDHNSPHTWNIHSYKGIGRLPQGLKAKSDPARRVLLDQLPRLLRGLAQLAHVAAVVVVVDTDNRDCKSFLADLRQVALDCGADKKTLFRLAIEEIEAWYFGDSAALTTAFPHAKPRVLNAYSQDSVCGTWETLAEALHPGGAKAAKQRGGPNAGDLKHEWADRIGPHMIPDRNLSPSFQKLRVGLLRITTGRES